MDATVALSTPPGRAHAPERGDVHSLPSTPNCLSCSEASLTHRSTASRSSECKRTMATKATSPKLGGDGLVVKKDAADSLGTLSPSAQQTSETDVRTGEAGLSSIPAHGNR